MAAGNYQPSDLSSVLRTLAQYAPPQASTGRAPGDGSALLEPRPQVPVPHPSVQDTKVSNPPVDPTAITDWSAGLRHVMRTVAQSEAAIASIGKLIQVQHEHEKQWWAGRQTLLKKQKARVEGREELNSVLRSIGGQLDPVAATSTPEEDAQEVKRYDIKVHKASVEMVKAMRGELKDLGVPFFGTPAGRVNDDDKLAELQNRMIELLEDMCKE